MKQRKQKYNKNISSTEIIQPNIDSSSNISAAIFSPSFPEVGKILNKDKNYI